MYLAFWDSYISYHIHVLNAKIQLKNLLDFEVCYYDCDGLSRSAVPSVAYAGFCEGVVTHEHGWGPGLQLFNRGGGHLKDFRLSIGCEAPANIMF